MAVSARHVAFFLVLSPSSALAAPRLEEAPEGRDPHPSDAAVVVGIEDYFVLPDAPGAVADAGAVKDYLLRTRGVPEDKVTVITDGANRERILAAAEAAGKLAGSGGTVWLYFAGHGVRDPATGAVHLLGADAQNDPAAFLPRAVSLEEVTKAMRSGKGRPMLWLDAGLGPNGRSDRALADAFAATGGEPAPLEVPPRSILWTGAPGANAQLIDGHGAFTFLSVGSLHGWADGHGGAPEDGMVTPEEAQAWAVDTARELDVGAPELHGDTTGLAWASGVPSTRPQLSANDVRGPEASRDDDGPTDVAAEADDILSDARLSLRRMAVGLGGDTSANSEEVTVGRVSGRAEEEALAPALAERLEAILPASVTSARFTSFTSRPPLSARIVTVNVDIERGGETETFLVEGIALPSSPNWPATAEQIGRHLLDQVEPAAAE